MVNINLKTELDEGKKKPFFRREVLTLVVVLLLLLVGYAGLLAYKSWTNSKITAAENEYAVRLAAFKSGNARDVFDFQNRINKSGELLAEKDRALEVMQKIEALTIPEVYIDTYSYENEKNKLTLNMVGKNYNNMARQVASFKNSGYFSDVSVSKSELSPDGEVKFPVTLVIK